MYFAHVVTQHFSRSLSLSLFSVFQLKTIRDCRLQNARPVFALYCHPNTLCTQIPTKDDDTSMTLFPSFGRLNMKRRTRADTFSNSRQCCLAWTAARVFLCWRGRTCGRRVAVGELAVLSVGSDSPRGISKCVRSLYTWPLTCLRGSKNPRVHFRSV